ncbi:MAG: hypothetical protein CMO55_13815 [Verrucomicrobiales bacterium]|nr:hypothetical protein [Verrucomicrobiales bacterium]
MEKDKAVAQLHKKIDKASRKIDELRLQTHLAKADAKTAFDKRVKTLEEQRNKLRNDIHHFQRNTSDAWEDLAEGCNSSWKELRTSLRNALNEYRSE